MAFSCTLLAYTSHYYNVEYRIILGLCLVQDSVTIVVFLLQMFFVTVAEIFFAVQDAIDIYQRIYIQLIPTSAVLVNIKMK